MAQAPTQSGAGSPVCSKVRYPDRATAVISAFHLAERGKMARDTRPYECPNCGKWHLTTRRAQR